MEPHDYCRYTRYGLQHSAAAAGLEVVVIEPACGFWITWAQRFVDTVVGRYCGRWSGIALEAVKWLLVPVLVAGAVLERLFGCRGDTLDNLLLACKPGAKPEGTWP